MKRKIAIFVSTAILLILSSFLKSVYALEKIEVTTVDPAATFYGTFQSHNQKVVSNQNGIFMSSLHARTESYFNNTWRLSRSTDGGKTFTVVYETNNSTSTPAIETDPNGNIYAAVSTDSNNATIFRFSLASQYSQPESIAILPGGSAQKFSMILDWPRQRFYYASYPGDGLRFYIITLDGQVIKNNYLLVQGSNGSPSYPILYIDATGWLYLAWTNDNLHHIPGQGYPYWSIHFMRSKDGGETWQKPDGTALTVPVVADETGPTARINLDDELTPSTYLASFVVKNSKVHFMYSAYLCCGFTGNFQPRQHYIRYDLTAAKKDIDVYPEWKGETISIYNLDGFCTTRVSQSDFPIYCISRTRDSHLGVLVSYDNGQTWHDYAQSDFNDQNLYSIGGAREVTADGYIIGSYTDQRTDSAVRFFKVKAVSTLASSCVSNSIPSTMSVGQSVPVSVVMLNTGVSPWVPPADYLFLDGWSGANSAWRPTSTGMPTSPVTTNQSVTFTFNLIAPTTAGTYNINYKMIRGGVAEFGALCGKTVKVAPMSTPTPTPTTTPTPSPLPAVRPQINIPDKKTIYLNGKPFIPRGIWNPLVIKLGELANKEVIKRRLAELGDRGFNMFLEKINCKTAEAGCITILNEVAAYNQDKTDPNEQIWVFFSVQDVLTNNKNDTSKAILEAREVVGKVYGYKYFLGMLLFDEPDYSTGVPANFLTVVNNELHETYPLFLSFIDLGMPASSKAYLNSADILAHEYHFYLTDQSHGPTYESYIATIKNRAEQFVNGTKDASGNYQKPVWAAVHTIGNYVDDKGILRIKEPPTSLQHLSIVQKWLEGGMTGFFAYSYQHSNWILSNASPLSWPDTSGDFGSPPLWNGLLSITPQVTITSPAVNCPKKISGDANCDDQIDGIDYSIWLNTQCRPSGSQRCADNRGDFNKDGNIDDDDYKTWFNGRE